MCNINTDSEGASILKVGSCIIIIKSCNAYQKVSLAPTIIQKAVEIDQGNYNWSMQLCPTIA